MGNSEPAPSKYRRLQGFPRLLEVAILSSLTFTGALWAVDLAGFLELAILREQYLGLFWAQILSAVFLLVPASRRAARDRVPWYDWIAVALSLTVGLNVMFFYPTLLYTSAIATPDKVLLGVASLVLLIEGTENPAFDPVWDNMPAEEGNPVTVQGAFVDVDDLLPDDRSYYEYTGSLTTPPCTEGVLWHVLAQPVEISAEQLSAFHAIHDGTNRPVQPMNERGFERP